MKLYLEGFTQNREISWLRYNERVLEEALDISVPLFERLRYISIFDNNLEEFFQVRVGNLMQDNIDNSEEIDSRSGMTAIEQLEAIEQYVRMLLIKRDKTVSIVEKDLSLIGITRLNINQLNDSQNIFCKKFFKDKIKSSVKVEMIENYSDFSKIDTKRVYLISKLKTDSGNKYALIHLPTFLPKILIFKKDNYHLENEKFCYVLTIDIVKKYIQKILFPFEIIEIHSIDMARTAEIDIDDSMDQMTLMKEILKRRKCSAVDKLFLDGEPSDELLSFIIENTDLNYNQIYMSKLISLDYISELEEKLSLNKRKDLIFNELKPFNQLLLGHGKVIDRVMKTEILSHYPYDSIEPFLELLREASFDERVKEIRITIYRLYKQSKIVKYLLKAAENGKKVSVLIELRARFDEENNIEWANELKAAGCDVFYGSKKYKVHSKFCQILLEDKYANIKYITNISTGNYNEKTIKLYTDFSLITYDQRIGSSINQLWNDLKNKKINSYEHILTSPNNMQKKLVKLINREANKGKEGRIFIKVNSITDEKIIEALMIASNAGCKIRMIVRGVCCLLPKIANCTENIEIVNVVGRFLEHSRVYIFGQAENEIMYISSADLMTRNMTKRIELACPIYSKKYRRRIKAILFLNFHDNIKGRFLKNDGKYSKKLIKNNKTINSQELLQDNR